MNVIAFADREVEDLLKPLSSNEDWVRKDDKTWVLPKAGAQALWDGSGKITITSTK